MTHGLQIYDQDSNLLLDSTDITWNIIGVYSVAANSSASDTVPVPYLSSFKYSMSLQSEIVDDQKTIAPVVSLSLSAGNLLSVSITNYQVPCTIVVLGR